jgi:hypothetical protein
VILYSLLAKCLSRRRLPSENKVANCLRTSVLQRNSHVVLLERHVHPGCLCEYRTEFLTDMRHLCFLLSPIASRLFLPKKRNCIAGSQVSPRWLRKSESGWALSSLCGAYSLLCSHLPFPSFLAPSATFTRRMRDIIIMARDIQ